MAWWEFKKNKKAAVVLEQFGYHGGGPGKYLHNGFRQVLGRM